MSARDRFGQPLEPNYPEPIATTWDGEPIYEGEEVYRTPSGDYIKADSINSWIKYNVGNTFIIEKEEF